MKFTVARDVLSEAVSWTARTLPNHPSVPILGAIRLHAADEVLTMSCFDYEISTRCEVQAEIDSPGEVLVSGRLLSEICKSLPREPVVFTSEENKVSLKCGPADFTLATMPDDDYPAMPQMPTERGSIDGETLAQAVSQVSIAASRDESLPLLTGVRMEVEDDAITLLATDRYRLAMRQMPWNTAQPGSQAALLLKARTLSDVAKSMTDGAQVKLAFSDEESSATAIIGFTADGKRTTSTLMDGDYPPVRRLFPEETQIHAVVKRDELLLAVKRVALVAPKKAPIRLFFSEGNLMLDAGADDNARATHSLPAILVGEDTVTAYNPGYLIDGLSVLGTEYVRFSFTEGARPSVLAGQDDAEGEPNDEFRYLLMPIRYGI